MTRGPTPRVSVLTAVRNARPYLDETIASIRSQTLAEWEWILVDDGSTDGSGEQLASWAARDRRLRVLLRPARGLVAALNDGLAQCRAPLVARMDADDIATPERLARQVAAFDADPRLTVADGCVELLGGSRNAGMHRYIEWLNGHRDHRSITEDIFVESPIAHPAACFRTAAVRALGGYRAGDFPEDYDLWLRLHAGGARFAKLETVVLRWRDHPRRMTRTDPRYRTAAFTALKQDFLWRYEGACLARGMVLWGAARGTRPWRQWLRRRGVRPLFVVDANRRRIGQRILGAEVHPVEAVRSRAWSYLLVTVSSPDSRAWIRDRLQRWGIDALRDRRRRFV